MLYYKIIIYKNYKKNIPSNAQNNRALSGNVYNLTGGSMKGPENVVLLCL